MRILVADDDRMTATILARTLERWGLEACVVRDGEEAWARIRDDAGIGLAILDWMMPGMDGPTLCRRIRQEERLSQLYLLLLTARDTHADIVAGLNAGANDYVTKPFDPEELRARVQVGLRVVTLQQRLADRVAALEEALAKVRRLQGLLPICCYCKSVRTDQNYWQQVEHYVSAHADVEFSHGICPSCFRKAAAELEGQVGP